MRHANRRSRRQIEIAVTSFALMAGMQSILRAQEILMVTNGNASGNGSLAAAIASANSFSANNSQPVTIDFSGVSTVNLATSGSGQLFVDSNVSINGGGATINGENNDRIFFIAGGTVSLIDLTLENGSATGGAAAGGGGGAGLGGAIFVANGKGIAGSNVTLATNVTLNQVAFLNNTATGGGSGVDFGGGTIPSGGGGLGGTAGIGGGGFGNGATGGGLGTDGQSGAFSGGASGGLSVGTSAGGSNGGGGGGNGSGTGGSGGGGVDGGVAGTANGGTGGFGGGGGGPGIGGIPGSGGFGGGGAAQGGGGSGGFGGGGGGSARAGATVGGAGGFGGGAGGGNFGGGGLGAGGAVFVQNGANLTLIGGSFSGNQVNPGSANGEGGGDGQAYGNGMFLLNSVAISAPNNTTTTFAQDIYANDVNTADLGTSNLPGITINDAAHAGTVVLSGNDDYFGGTNVVNGTLQVGDGSGDGALVGANGGTTAGTAVTLNGGNLVNDGGSITGGTGGTFTLFGGTGGAAVVLTSASTMVNSGQITGGAGGVGNDGIGFGRGGNGGDGIDVSNGGEVINMGTISGGQPGPFVSAQGPAGMGIVFSNAAATFSNQGTVNGGVSMPNAANAVALFTSSRINGPLNIGNSTSALLTLAGGGTESLSQAATGGITFSGTISARGTGLWIDDQPFTAAAVSVISGTIQMNGNSAVVAPGTAGANAATMFSGTLINGGTITGGTGATQSESGGSGGAGVQITSPATFINTAKITGGTGGSNSGILGFGGVGGSAVIVSNGGTVINQSGSIAAGSGGAGPFGVNPASPAAIQFNAGAGTLINQSTIVGDVLMANAANSVSLYTGSLINGRLNVGTSPTSQLTLNGSGTQALSQTAIGGISFNGNLIKQDAGKWIFDQPLVYSGSTTVTQGAIEAAAPLNTGGLSISGGGFLDLDSSLLISYGSNSDPIGTILSYLKDGNAVNWSGGEIRSSAVAAANGGKLIYSVGYADGADGLNVVPSGDIGILPTLVGDARLQGNVVFGDFQLLSQYFGQSGTSWDEGNFTYGSGTNFGDFQLLSQNFGQNAGGLTSGELASINGFASQFGEAMVSNGSGYSLVSVPEPASTIMIGMAAMSVLVRRRKQS